MNLPPFVLYGLIGCPHCEVAERYLRARNIPASLVIANDDPIAKEGAKTICAPEAEQYPLLVSRVTKEVITGFKEDDYARVLSAYFALASASTSSVFASQQQPQPQTPVQA